MRKKKITYQQGGIDLPNTEDWQRMNPQINGVNLSYNPLDYKKLPDPVTSQVHREFDITQPNAWGFGIMGAFLGSKALLNNSNKRNYQSYKDRWIRNYNIPSLIQDPNKQSSDMYESPIYQQGGKYGTATSADSLSLYNNSVKVQDYYKQRGYYKSHETLNPPEDLKGWNDIITSVNQSSYNSLEKGRFRTATDRRDDDIIASSQYKMKLDENRYLQREAAHGILDLRSPMQMFDKRVTPTYSSDLENRIPGDSLRGDLLTLYSYDPLAVKPWNMLTEAERKLRIQKYGSNANPNYDATKGISSISNPSGAQNMKKTLTNTTRKIQPANKPIIQQSEPKSSVTPGYNPNPQRPVLPQGESVFGPANSMIGTYNNGQFTPDYNNTAQRTEANKADTDLINDPKALQDLINRKYGKGKIISKQKGGMTMRTPEQQGAGYFAYPNASSLTFPGSGERTFVPGPFPLKVKDSRGTQIMTNRPIKTYGKVIEMPIFEQGGEVKTLATKVKRKDATIEAQKGELIFGAGAPGDVEDQEDRVGVGLYRIGGKNHSDGGTPLKAHPGDFVFSKETSLAPSQEDAKLLVGKEIKRLKDRTPAALANKYMKMNEFISMAQDEELDPITKKTAILNVNNFIDRLAEVAYAQEEKKGFPDGVPEFVQASLQTRFDQKGLQGEMDSYKMGGQVQKYQAGGTTDPWDMASLVTKPSPGFQRAGTRGWNTLYSKSGTVSPNVKQAIPGGTPGKPWESWIINQLQSGVTIDELVKKGHGTPGGLTQQFGQYYKPAESTQYQRTADPFKTPRMTDYPQITQLAPNVPYKLPDFNLGAPATPQDAPPDTFTEGSNQNFNINLAEATNLLASWAPSESRYPPAFRNYEIQNAKAQIASTGRPISEQPYLNAINRSQLGFDQNNNPYGAAGATRSLGAFQSSLGAQNQAISQVYNQNIARQDQRAGQLAQLEVQDGVDRITNAEKYDNKLEMLANNKELERKDRLRNTALQFNQMVSDREQKRLFNTMSEWYQINPSGTIGLKPVYKIENGKLTQVQRNVRDLVTAQQSTTQQFNPSIQLAQQLEKMGYSHADIVRIISKTTDDYDKPNNRQ